MSRPAIDKPQGFRWRHDRNLPVSVQREQVLISGNDHVTLAEHSQGEHRIVIGVARHWPRKGRRVDYLGQFLKAGQYLLRGDPRSREDEVKLRPLKYINELGQERRAAQKSQMSIAHALQNRVGWPAP